MATATKRLVASPKSIEQAKAKAVELCRQAYSPQPVPQPDGSTLQLCWEGRVNRAWELWQAAKESGDADKALRIEQAALKLNGEAQTAKAAAEKAASDYGVLVSSAGQRLEDVYPAECACEGCKRTKAQERYFRAETALCVAVSALLEPSNANNMPALVSLIDDAGEQKARDLLWRALKRIADAQKEYAAACQNYDQTPNWRRAMYGEAG